MTAMQRETTFVAHQADANTTVARVRLYDGKSPASQRIGFNCRAEDFLDLDAISDYIRDYRHHDGSTYQVSERLPLDSVDRPYVTAAYEVHPPLAADTQEALGAMLVAGAFLYDSDRRPEGSMLIDNTGNQQPDHPFDTGRYVIAQTPIRP
jgi:hypothetical protein